MRLATAVRVLLLSACIALATRVAGWWAPAAVGAAWAALADRSWRASAHAALCTLFGWGALLLWTAAWGPLGAVARVTAEIFTVPPVALVMATLLYGALLAASAAGLVAAMAPSRTDFRG